MRSYIVLTLLALFFAIAMICMALAATSGLTPKDILAQHTNTQTAP